MIVLTDRSDSRGYTPYARFEPEPPDVLRFCAVRDIAAGEEITNESWRRVLVLLRERQLELDRPLLAGVCAVVDAFLHELRSSSAELTRRSGRVQLTAARFD